MVCAGGRPTMAMGGEFRAVVLQRVSERYQDFGPTLASEHLAADDQLPVSAETLRRWLRAAGTQAQGLPEASGAEGALRQTGAVGRQPAWTSPRSQSESLSGSSRKESSLEAKFQADADPSGRILKLQPRGHIYCAMTIWRLTA
jgi:hypothetical protein